MYEWVKFIPKLIITQAVFESKIKASLIMFGFVGFVMFRNSLATDGISSEPNFSHRLPLASPMFCHPIPGPQFWETAVQLKVQKTK